MQPSSSMGKWEFKEPTAFVNVAPYHKGTGVPTGGCYRPFHLEIESHGNYYYYLHYQVTASRDLGRPLNSVGETDHVEVTEVP